MTTHFAAGNDETTTPLSCAAPRRRHSATPEASKAIVDLWEAAASDAHEECITRAFDNCADYSSTRWRQRNGSPLPPAEKRGVLTAHFLHRHRTCTLTFDQAADKLRITKTSSKGSGREKTMLYVPMHAIINIETPEERDRRQRLYAMNDETAKMSYNNKESHLIDRYVCTMAEAYETDDNNLFFHSRVSTVGSSGSGVVLNRACSILASRTPGASRTGLGSTGSSFPVSPCFLQNYPTKYVLHYARTGSSGAATGGKKSIHTIELAVSEKERGAATTAFAVVKAILRRVYLQGPKRIIAFISPKSGKGHGVTVFKSTVMPFLHFSRHTVRVIVTARAHHCEDYLANLENPMDEDYVAVAVGGDGMMHEMVNGIHRRKIALMELIRTECRRRVAEQKEMSLPLPLPEPSARRQEMSGYEPIGYNLASANGAATAAESADDAARAGACTVEHVRKCSREENSDDGDVSSPSAVREPKKRRGVVAEEGADGASCISAQHRDGHATDPDSSPADATGTPKANRTHDSSNNTGCSYDEDDDYEVAAEVRDATEPVDGAPRDTQDAATPPAASIKAVNGEEKGRPAGLPPMVVPTPPFAAAAAAASLASPPQFPTFAPAPPLASPTGQEQLTLGFVVTEVFLEHGWKALLPLTATVPTGSACGLAKSADVLSAAEAALALVHLSACGEDLLLMKFTPNNELVQSHRDHLGRKRVKAAEKHYHEYLSAHAADMKRHTSLDSLYLQQQHMYLDPTQSSTLSRSVQSMQSATVTSPLLTHSQRTRTREYPSEDDTASGGDAAAFTSTGARQVRGNDTPPFLPDGSGVYPDAISYAVGAPFFNSRIAFMSLSFGVANDIDHNSEPLRWMGNARFSFYGGYVLLKGVRTYPATIRYLPWEDVNGMRMEKVHKTDLIPDPSQLPRCTMRADCPHCLQYPPPQRLQRASAEARNHCSRNSLGGAMNGNKVLDGSAVASAAAEAEANAEAVRRGMRSFTVEQPSVLDASVVAQATDAELLGEDDVDFDDDKLPWVTIRGDIYNLLICNIRDVAQDMMMAPLSHMNDGAIDLVFSRLDYETRKGGRKEFLQFFGGLEKGEHVNLWFTNYVKARAVEVKVDAGISMSDGEMMPLSSVRMTKIRAGNRLVRSDE